MQNSCVLQRPMDCAWMVQQSIGFQTQRCPRPTCIMFVLSSGLEVDNFVSFWVITRPELTQSQEESFGFRSSPMSSIVCVILLHKISQFSVALAKNRQKPCLLRIRCLTGCQNAPRKKKKEEEEELGIEGGRGRGCIVHWSFLCLSSGFTYYPQQKVTVASILSLHIGRYLTVLVYFQT